MLKPLAFAALLMAGTSAAAQTTTPAPAPTTAPVAQPATSATPATPATPADEMAPTTSATPATPADPAAAAAPVDTSVEGTIEADWAGFDVDKNDALSKAEFGKWIGALQTASGGKAPTSSYLNAAYKKADADKKNGVDKTELATFLKG